MSDSQAEDFIETFHAKMRESIMALGKAQDAHILECLKECKIPIKPPITKWKLKWRGIYLKTFIGQQRIEVWERDRMLGVPFTWSI